MLMSKISGEISEQQLCRWITAVSNDYLQIQEWGFGDDLRKHGSGIMFIPIAGTLTWHWIIARYTFSVIWKRLLWKHWQNNLGQRFSGPASRRRGILEWLTWQGYWWEKLWETPGSWTASPPWCLIAAHEHIPGMTAWTHACCSWVHPKRQNTKRPNNRISFTRSKN